MRGAKPNLKPALCPSGAPAQPDWLTGEAAAEWSRVAPILSERRILTEADLGSLENYCAAIGQVRECQATLARLGSMFFEGDNGVPRPHPAVRVMHSAMTISRQLAAELGLTPVSRSRPAVTEEPDEGGISALLD